MYVIGEEGILKELELAGFQYLGGPVSNNATEISHSHGYQSAFANFDRAKSLKYGLTQLRFHRRAADRRRQEDRAQAWSLHGARRRCTYDPSPRSGGVACC